MAGAFGRFRLGLGHAPGLTGTAPQALGQPLIWTGSQDSTWSNTNGSVDWTVSGVPTTDNGGNAVIFDDSAGANFSIAVNPAGVVPLSVQFNNVNYAYSFSGGAIGGAATAVTLGTLGQPGGSVSFLSANSYGGGTFVESGTLSLGNAAALGVGGLTANGGVLDLAGISPAALPSLNGLAGTITSGAPSAVALTVSPIATSAFGGVLQNGAGTLSLAVNGGTFPLVLYGANTYSGGTTISSGGTLQLGNGVSNGSVAGNISNGGGLAFNNTNPQTYGGVISGNGLLDALGPSLLVLANTNSFSGGTTISSGTLQLGNGVTNGSVSGSIADSGVLAFNNAAAQTYAGAIGGNGGLNVLGPGLVVLTNTNGLSGATTISGGTLQLGNGSVNGSLAGNIADNSVLAFKNAAAQTYAGILSGGGTLNAGGPGLLVLSNSNTFSGPTTVSGGTLSLGNAGALQSSAVTVSGGTLALSVSAGSLGSLSGRQRESGQWGPDGRRQLQHDLQRSAERRRRIQQGGRRDDDTGRQPDL